MTLNALGSNKIYKGQSGLILKTQREPIYTEIQNLISLITNQRKSNVVSDAIECAIVAHEGQTRKGTDIPYVIHPLRVGLKLSELGCSDDVVVAGILHDTVEDTPVTDEDLKRDFGEKVAALVAGASEPDKSDTWENRKHHTIEYLKTAPREVLLISAADKLDNAKETLVHLKEVGDKHWAAFNRPKEQQRWYYKSLAEVFVSRIEDDTTDRLFKEYKQEVDKIFG